jgi:hypothetical protein
MPFGNEFDLVFKTVRKSLANSGLDAEIDCYFLKDECAAGRITDDIICLLQESALCIADVTGNNPNR